LISPIVSGKDFSRLERVLMGLDLPDTVVEGGEIIFPRPQRVISMKDAVFSDYEEIGVEESVNRICAGVKAPCPPAIPIVVSGEVITGECVKILKKYGISRINVVK
jgi:hypothetical protein